MNPNLKAQLANVIGNLYLAQLELATEAETLKKSVEELSKQLEEARRERPATLKAA